jgi:Tol biopolymer transport system component/DNA-binding winged helix-turn-helix (wHTH) protein
MTNDGKEFYEFGAFRLDPAERLLLRDGAPVQLTPKAFDLLLVLVRNSGHLLAKEELLREVWPDSFVEEGSLTFTVSALRKALGGEEARRFIETVPKRGYRFASGVRLVPGDARYPAAAASAVVDAGPQAELALPAFEPVGAPGHAPANELDEAVATGPAKAADDRPSEQANESHPRAWRPATWVLAVAAAVAVAIGGFGLYWLVRRSAAGEPGAAFRDVEVTRLTSGINVAKVAIAPDGKYVGYVAREAGQQSLWIRQVATNSHVQLVPAAEVGYLEIRFSPDGNYLLYSTAVGDEEPATYQVPVIGGPSRRVDGPYRPFRATSPDGRQVFFLDLTPGGNLGLMVADAANVENRRMLTSRPGSRGIIPAAWSPDGQLIMCRVDVPKEDGVYEALVTVRVSDGVEERVTDQEWRFIGEVVWLPNGDGLLVTVSERPFGPYQICHVSYPGGEVRRVTNDTNNYVNLSVTSSSDALAALKADIDPIVWVAPGGDSARAKQVTFGPGTQNDYWGLSWTPDGRVVYESTAGGNQDIWVMDADGRRQRQLTAEGRANFDPAVSPDGRFIAFVSERAGATNIWRMEADGGNPRQLTTGDASNFLPSWSPDGRWLVYTSGMRGPFSLWKMSAEGGIPTQLSAVKSAAWPVVSPDGTLVACWAFDERTRRTILAIVPFEGEAPPRFLETPPTANTWAEIRWTADGKALMYVDTREGVGNIWSQPIDGGPATQITDFRVDRIFRFDRSRADGSLVCSRGTEANDVVLIRGFRAGS